MSDRGFEPPRSTSNSPCERRALDVIKNHQASIPPAQALYHYTTAEGLLGIVNDQRIRATHAAYMNDFSELEYGLDVVREVLENKVGYSVAFDLSNVVEDNIFSAEAYIVSFSTEPDVLSQWRAYANDGLGYTLGLAPSTRLAVNRQEIEILAVEYHKDDQANLIKEVCLPALEGAHDYSNPEVIKTVGGELTQGLRHLLPILKNPGFQEESERRGVLKFSAAHAPPAKFRPSRFGLTPYVEMVPVETERLMIVEVWLGPKLSGQRRASTSLEEFLKSHGYEAGQNPRGYRLFEVGIELSEVSYR